MLYINNIFELNLYLHHQNMEKQQQTQYQEFIENIKKKYNSNRSLQKLNLIFTKLMNSKSKSGIINHDTNVCIYPHCISPAFIINCRTQNSQKLHDHFSKNQIKWAKIDKLIQDFEKQNEQEKKKIQIFQKQVKIICLMLKNAFTIYLQQMKRQYHSLYNLKFEKAFNKIKKKQFLDIKGMQMNLIYDKLSSNLSQRHKKKNNNEKFTQLLNRIRLNVNQYIQIQEQQQEWNKQDKKKFQHLLQSIKYLPNKGSKYNQIAKLHSKYHEYDQAILNYNKAILNYKYKSTEAYFNRAIVYKNKNRKKQALEDFSKAIQLGSMDPETYTNRADILIQMQQYEKAVKDCNSAIKYDSKNSKAFYLLGIIQKKKNIQISALQNYRKSIQYNPEFLPAYLQRGQIFFKNGQFQEALIDFNKAISGLLKQSHKVLGKCILKITNDALTFNKDQVIMCINASFYKRGLLYKKIQQYDKALRDFKFIQQADSFYKGIYFEIGQIQYLLRNYKAAQIYLLESIQKNESKIDKSYYILAKIYYQRKNLIKAKQYVTKAILTAQKIVYYILRGIINHLLQFYDQQNQDFGFLFRNILKCDQVYLLQEIYKQIRKRKKLL